MKITALLILLIADAIAAGCASNPPAVKTAAHIAGIETLPVQLYLDVTCSNSYLLPDEYTVFVTNSVVVGSYAAALEVNATAFEDVDIPISGNIVFLKAKNQIGE